MKIIALGDTHGRVIWKDIVAKELESSDKIIFIGDYFDTRDNGISGNKQIVNFKELLQLKRDNPDKVVLLFGNHDFHYLRGVGETYSGYQAGYAIDIGAAINDAIAEGIMQMCYRIDKYVFTHAGVTKTWCLDNEIDVTNLETSINDLFKYKPLSFKFTMGDNYSQTGNDVCQSPIWVRPVSLLRDMVDDITCVVGHTTVNEIGISDKLILIDTLGITGDYLTIIDGVPSKSI